jgi:hypothetical protein
MNQYTNLTPTIINTAVALKVTASNKNINVTPQEFLQAERKSDIRVHSFFYHVDCRVPGRIFRE